MGKKKDIMGEGQHEEEEAGYGDKIKTLKWQLKKLEKILSKAKK